MPDPRALLDLHTHCLPGMDDGARDAQTARQMLRLLRSQGVTAAALPLPKTVILSMSQHIGAPCRPLVKTGDPVAVGQIVADASADTLLVNAAECEPYITSDYRECIENAPDILFGIRKVMEYLQIPRAIIGIENNKPRAAALLERLCKEAGENIRVKLLPARYPHGAEKVLIDLCTGRRVPPGKLPADAGCVVMNVTSAGFLGRYLQTGISLIEKCLTVAGEAVTSPGNIRAPIGTPVSEILAFCGLDEEKAAKLLMGGPMMGLALMTPDLPILKQNNAILALGRAEAAEKPETACIRCGRFEAAAPSVWSR